MSLPSTWPKSTPAELHVQYEKSCFILSFNNINKHCECLTSMPGFNEIIIIMEEKSKFCFGLKSFFFSFWPNKHFKIMFFYGEDKEANGEQGFSHTEFRIVSKINTGLLIFCVVMEPWISCKSAKSREFTKHAKYRKIH